MIAVSIMLLLIGEFVLRMKGDTYSWGELNGRGYISPYDKSQSTCLHKRDRSEKFYNSPDFNYSLDLNKIGLRDRDHLLASKEGVNRIVGLGDSFTEGMGAPVDSTWLALLEKRLNFNCKDSFDVISGGVAGADVQSSYMLYDSILKKYRPDYVVLVVNQTDVNDFFVRGGLERFKVSGCPPKDAPRIEPLFRASHLVRSILINLFGYNWQLISPEHQRKLYSDFKEELIFISKLIADDSTQVVIVFHPLKQEAYAGQYFYDFSGLMNDLTENEITYVDVLDKINNVHKQDLDQLYWPNDMHFTPVGYNLFAKEVLSTITFNCEFQ